MLRSALATLPLLRLTQRSAEKPAARRPTLRASYDVIVIGGGVRALAIARSCAANGAAVALLAPGEIAAAPDERAWPVVRSAHGDRLRLAVEARAPKRVLRLISRLPARVPRQVTGCLALSGGAETVEALTAVAAQAKAARVDAWMLPAREVAALSPPLAGGRALAPALHEHRAVTLDADALALALATAIAEAGVDLFPFTQVSALDREDGEVRGVVIGDAVVAAGAVVLADDLSAIRLVREGKGRLSLKREERLSLTTEPGAPYIGPALIAGDVTLSRDPAGVLTTSGPIDALAERLVRLAPSLSGLSVAAEEPVTVWTGIDGRAQVGAADIPGLWLALGFGRDPLSAAGAAARQIAGLLFDRRVDPAFEPFAPTRRPAARERELSR